MASNSKLSNDLESLGVTNLHVEKEYEEPPQDASRFSRMLEEYEKATREYLERNPHLRDIVLFNSNDDTNA